MKADDFGRFHGDPRLVRCACFPLLALKDSTVGEWLSDCELAGLVVSYEVDGRRYVSIVDFKQRMRQMTGKFPPPNGQAVDWTAPRIAAVGGQLTDNCQTVDGQPQAMEPSTVGGVPSTDGLISISKEISISKKISKVNAPSGAVVASEKTMHGALSVYAVAWEARYSSPPHPSARDCVAANSALRAFEPAIRAQLLAAYVADEDPWLCDNAHPLGLFPRQIDKLRARLNGKLSHGSAPAKYVNPRKGFQEPGFNQDLDLTALAASRTRTVEE